MLDEMVAEFGVWTALSNANGAEIARRAADLTLSNPKNADFEAGADNATVFGGYGLGILRDEKSHPRIAEILRALPSADRGTVAGILYQALFVDELRTRLG